MKPFWREPLIHFFILGLAVTGLHAFLEREPETIDDDPYLVEVSSADIEWMQTLFNKQMGRQPTVNELRGQVNQLIREQVLSREAVAIGLDQGDGVVRRRLAQKMEFFFRDLSDMSEPTQDELRNYYRLNRSKYVTPATVSLTQVYFNPEHKGLEPARQAVQAFLVKNPDPSQASAFGHASMLMPDCSQCSAKEIANRFGEAFAQSAVELESGRWHGPVASAYGLHAVYIHDRREARVPEFQALAEKIKNDWQAEKRSQTKKKVYEEIRSRYRVLVEGLPYEMDISG